jgi:hypothetical protein
VVCWFDWDQDFLFESGEYYTIGSGSNTTLSTNITIPATAAIGKIGCRIYMCRSGYIPAANACTSYADGEIEDYCIIIDDGTHCSNGIKDADEVAIDCGGADCKDCWSYVSNTGINVTSTDYSEDVNGDSWTDAINVQAGDMYYLMVNKWSSGGSGFDLLWSFTEGAAMDCSVLPIELLEMNANCNNNDVVVKWKTLSEINNDYFVLLKSYNYINYIPIETVDGAGNSNEIKEYFVKYHEDYNGTVYYKLKQVDFDGEITYSELFVTSCVVNNTPYVIIPNPTASGFFNVIGATDNDKIEVFNMIGQKCNVPLQKGCYLVFVNDMCIGKLIVN